MPAFSPHKRSVVILLVAFSIIAGGCSRENRDMKPPAAKRIPHIHQYHNDQLVDYYYWLRNQSDPDVMEYLKAENRYTDRMMAHTDSLQEKLYREMVGRIKENDQSVPVRIDDYYYYKRTEEKKQYPVYCRKYGSLDQNEEIILDQNEIAMGLDFCNIGVFRVSPDHRLLLYSVDTTGSEDFTIYIKDLTTGELYSDRIPHTSYDAEWMNDSNTFLYTVLDSIKRPFKVYRHGIGTDPAKDILVYHEGDEAYFIDLKKSRNRRYIFMKSESQVTTEVYYLSTSSRSMELSLINPRQYGIEYYVDHHDGHFYIVTNHSALNFRVVRTPVKTPGIEHWTDIIPHRDGVKIESIDLFSKYMVITQRENGLKQLVIRNLSTGDSHYVEFPEPVYTFRSEQNPEFGSDYYRFSYTSLITPETVYDYHMKNRSMEVKKREEVGGGYDPSDYVTERIFAVADDSTYIPVSLVYHKKLKKGKAQPLVLYGYGSYGSTIEPGFKSHRISLLDRGIIYAIAHIRGGGEMGREWYEDGKLLNKMNTFTDFIACAEFLINEGYTSHDRLVISGGSAGGLLMGAVVNMRPDLCKAVLTRVPFVDVLNTMMDTSIPLTVIEYDEWGNPNEKDYYEYIKSYSPYDNVHPADYPNMLITAGLYDSRVSYWEPAKWTASLRVNNTGDNLILLKTEMESGHGGASGRYDTLREIAFKYAFVLDILNIE